MFSKPRLRTTSLPSSRNKVKNKCSVDEIAFDTEARHEFLTGFHKRKQQRIKQAQEAAAKKARQEKLYARKQMREDRRREIEEHVLKVNQLLRNSGAVLDSDDSHDQTEAFGAWEGLSDKPAAELTCHEEEYIDEDRYTTVTVEPVSVSRDGLSKPQPPSDQVESDENNGKGSDRRSLLGKAEVVAAGKDGKSLGIRKKKTKKFRYESRAEKLLADRKRKR